MRPAVNTLCTFFAAAASAEILGPQDSPNFYADSNLAFCPSSLQGDAAGLQSGGDDLISYSHDTWLRYLEEGFTEYIEVIIVVVLLIVRMRARANFDVSQSDARSREISKIMKTSSYDL